MGLLPRRSGAPTKELAAGLGVPVYMETYSANSSLVNGTKSLVPSNGAREKWLTLRKAMSRGSFRQTSRCGGARPATRASSAASALVSAERFPRAKLTLRTMSLRVACARV